MSTHATGRLVAVATRHGLQDLAVLVMRLDEAIALAELGAPERCQTGADADGLFHQELVVRRAINRLMELAVEVVVGVDVAAAHPLGRGILHFLQLAAFDRRDAVGRQADAHRLDLGGGLKHVHDALGRHHRHGDAAPRADVHHAGHGELAQGLADRGP